MVVTVSGADVRKKDGVVILPVKEYRRLLEAAVPEIYLTGKAAKRLDALVERGLREHREGKTRRIHSLADLD